MKLITIYAIKHISGQTDTDDGRGFQRIHINSADIRNYNTPAFKQVIPQEHPLKFHKHPLKL